MTRRGLMIWIAGLVAVGAAAWRLGSVRKMWVAADPGLDDVAVTFDGEELPVAWQPSLDEGGARYGYFFIPVAADGESVLGARARLIPRVRGRTR